MSFIPTPEQAQALDLFDTGDRLVIEARAGAGKTSTLALLAKNAGYDDKRVAYIAFNKQLVVDSAGKFGRNTACATAHSLAYQAVGRRYAHRMQSSRRMHSDEIARILGIAPIDLTGPDGHRHLTSKFLAGHVMRAVTAFCQTADPEPAVQHFPFLEGIDRMVYSDLEGWHRDNANNLAVAKELLPKARKAWADLSDRNGRLQFWHPHYLKLWQLDEKPFIFADVILWDEVQDASDVMLDVVMRQTHAQLVAVGDSEQQLYQWAGAIDALTKIPDAKRAWLTQCQPAGTMVRQAVQVNGREWTHRDVPIEALSSGDLVVSWVTKGLRKTGRPITDVNVRPHDGPLVVVDAGGRTSRYAPNHECVVVLGDLAEGSHCVYMMERNGQYRIGRCPWKYANGVAPIRRAVREQADAMWLLSVHETEGQAALHEALAQVQFGIPGAGWVQDDHYKMSLPDFWTKIGDNSSQADACLRHHKLLIDYPLWRRSTKPGAGWTTQVVTAAANVRSGMKMLVPGAVDGETNGSELGFVPWSAWSPITVRSEWYTGPIYSLSVDVDHTYVADGIVTHNSFRFGTRIADTANQVLDWLGAEPHVRGTSSILDRVGPIVAPDAILTRTNGAALEAVLDAIDNDTPVALVGGAEDLVKFAWAARDLKEGRRTDHPELACFSTWAEVLTYVEEDPQGGELKLLVDLVQRYTPGLITAMLHELVDEKAAQLVVSTAHKSKGREWPTVRLAGDFPDVPEELVHEVDQGELRLLYVAATRAKTGLDVSRVPLFFTTPEKAVPTHV